MGNMEFELFAERSPITVNNFIFLADDGFYNGIIFHRVIPNFMIQGGGFESNLQKKPNAPPIQNEADNGLSNLTGTVAMARTSDPHSASSQFFINVSDNLFLDHRNKTNEGWGYAVFARVISGMNVVNKIQACETTSQDGHKDVPVIEVTIESTEINQET